ncbi:ABC-three component system protein [Micromonospora sp. NPDC049523]|uniref:ABC-three component system protein n=1 Tax=Micromonospora sp. NPDC049523 TaxID=3155921 RepID=UPI00341CD52A
MPAGEHNASGSLVGYMYQVHWCLLELLKRGPERPDFAISLELHDDVAWDLNGSPQDLLQTKHHLNSNAGLGDKDVDVWKTLLVWIETAKPGDQHGPQLFLVSTSHAADDSAAGLLRPDGRRDVVQAICRFDDAATTSTNDKTAKARQQYLALTPSQRGVFVDRIWVLDDAPRIGDVDAAVRRALWNTLPLDHEDMFLSLVWKWWTAVALDMLQGKKASVTAAAARTMISGIRDRFSDDHLPTTIELSDVDEDTVVTSHENRPFVHQMQWVRCNTTNLRKAIIDYHRAVAQTVEWVADDIIGLRELERFEDNLRDEWQRHFADMVEDLGDAASEPDRIAAGKTLLRELRESTAVNVRPKYNDSFFARGKRHELADRGRMGWHPDFERLMENLMISTATSAAGQP